MGQPYQRKYGSPTAFTIDIASLASSTDGKTVNHSTLVDNSTVGAEAVNIYVKIKTASTGRALEVASVDNGVASYWGAGPDAHIYIWGYRADAATPNVITDGIAATKASGIAIKNAELIGTIAVPAPNAGTVFQQRFKWLNPGPFFAIGIGHDTEAALSSTAGDHAAYYITENPYIASSDV